MIIREETLDVDVERDISVTLHFILILRLSTAVKHPQALTQVSSRQAEEGEDQERLLRS